MQQRLGSCLGLALGLSLGSCDPERPPPVPSYTEPDLAGCDEPEIWLDKSCDDICHELDAEVGCADECGLGPAVGWRRLDACFAEEPQFAAVELTCDEVLDEEWLDSIYFVSCCCMRTGS